MALFGGTDTLAAAPKNLTPTVTFAAAAVAAADETITVAGHGLATGQRVKYVKSGSTAVVGLTDATGYFVIRNDENTVKLATSKANALAGTAINITGTGNGTADTLQVTPTDLFFVDTEEAAVAGNRANGIKTPGWVKYETYGNGRKRVETLVAMKRTAAEAGDVGILGNDDSTVADS